MKTITGNILFLDVTGWSKLEGPEIEAYVTTALPNLKQYLNSATSVNTWGDAIVAIFPNAKDAAESALSIRDYFKRGGDASSGVAPGLSCRIALHQGELIECHNPLTGRQDVFGSGIHLAARLEPETRPGQVFCTPVFAKALEVMGVCGPRPWELAELALPKGFGSIKPFAVTWQNEDDPRSMSAKITTVAEIVEQPAPSGAPLGGNDMNLALMVTDIREGRTPDALERWRQAFPAAHEHNPSENDVGFYALVHYLGSSDTATRELRRLATIVSGAPYANLALAKIEFGLQNYSAAQALADLAVEQAPNDDARVNALAFQITILRTLDRHDEAREALQAHLARFRDGDLLHTLFVALVELEASASDDFAAALAAHCALTYKSDDHSQRFAAGYRFSQGGTPIGDDLALLHYNTLINATRGDSGSSGVGGVRSAAQNNMGVLCRRLELNGLSTFSYIQSSEHGNTLATANLAHVYVGVGDFERAKALLVAAQSIADLHPNVAHVLRTLEETRESQENQFTKRLESAAIASAFLSNFGAAYFVAPTSPLPSCWKADGRELVIAADTLSWTDRDHIYIASGTLHGDAWMGELRRKPIDETPSSASMGLGKVYAHTSPLREALLCLVSTKRSMDSEKMAAAGGSRNRWIFHADMTLSVYERFSLPAAICGWCPQTVPHRPRRRGARFRRAGER